MKTLVNMSVLAVVLIAWSCKDTGTVSNTTLAQPQGQLLLKFAGAPDGITSVVARLSRDGFPTRTLNLAVSDTTASGSFDEVAVGVWHLKVEAMDSTESVRFAGETDVEVHAGETSHVSLQLIPTSGRIEITVTWGNPPQDSGLILYLPFNGNANDESGHGNNGIVSGATLTSDRSENPNSAYAFDGMDNHISIPDVVSDTVAAFSMSAWVFLNDISHRRFALYSGANLGEGLLQVWDAQFSFQVNFLDAGIFDARAPADTGRFVHLVGVYRRGDRLEIWVDGSLGATTAIPPASLNHGRTTHHSSIGSYAPEWLEWGRESGIYSWSGKIDQVRIYTRALSGSEILSLYQSGQ